MTSEVVLMNRQAVAMAADSAVTISGDQYLKTYQSVDKLFPLVDGQPVAGGIFNQGGFLRIKLEQGIRQGLSARLLRGFVLDTAVNQFTESRREFVLHDKGVEFDIIFFRNRFLRRPGGNGDHSSVEFIQGGGTPFPS